MRRRGRTLGRLRVTRFAHGGFVSALSNNMVNVLPAALILYPPINLKTVQPQSGFVRCSLTRQIHGLESYATLGVVWKIQDARSESAS